MKKYAEKEREFWKATHESNLCRDIEKRVNTFSLKSYEYFLQH